MLNDTGLSELFIAGVVIIRKSFWLFIVLRLWGIFLKKYFFFVLQDLVSCIVLNEFLD